MYAEKKNEIYNISFCKSLIEANKGDSQHEAWQKLGLKNMG